jgi:hypothetical protein
MKKILFLVLALGLSACANSAGTAELPENQWVPGLIGVPGESASGFGPAGYPGVRDDSIDSEPVQQFLASVGLRTSDLETGEALLLAPKGNLISQPTMQLCAHDFESEYARLVRRKIEIVDTANDPIGIHSEAIQYESQEAAALAVEELKNIVIDCGDTGEYVVGINAFKFDFLRLGIQSASATDFSNAVLTFEYSAESTHMMQIWHQRGNTLVLVQVSSTSEIDLVRINEISNSIAQRLQDANPLDIGDLD